MKFAHIADSHLGAFSKNPTLKELNMRAFEMAIKKSVEEGVDFIIIAGDLFHNPLPDMDTVHHAVRILNYAKERGIRTYAVYGSHDFSAGTTSLLDVLAEAGVFIKATRYEIRGEKIRLLPVVDERTGVKIVGVPGLTASMEVRYFKENVIDLDYLERLDGQKIFVFHTTIAELKPAYISDKNVVPISKFPKGFDYYAGGHLHEKIESNINGSPVIYPGALFGSNYSDLDILSGKERGFYIVDNFKPRFVPINVCEFEKKIIDATGKSAKNVENELLSFASQSHEGKVVILKVRGVLRSGRVADINFRKVREKIMNTAIEVLLNTYSLSTEERKTVRVPGSTPEEIEDRIFGEISIYGLEFTKNLFHVLREEKKEGENRRDYESRIWRNVYPLLVNVIERKTEDKRHAVTEERKIAEKKDLRERGANKKVKRASLFDFG